MDNHNRLDIMKDEDGREIVKLVQSFLELVEDLLSKGIITKNQYDEMVDNKIKFLEDIKSRKIG